MNTYFKAALAASVLSVAVTGGAFAKVSREAAIKTCVAKAQESSPNATDEERQTTRVRIYSSCMKQQGHRP